MPDEQDVEMGRELIQKAEEHLDEAADAADQLPASSPSSVITSAQLSIELSAKAIFLLSGINFPESHGFPFDPDERSNLTRNLVRKAKAGDYPDGFVDIEKIPRVLFLTQFWEQFYQPAKYPEQDLGVRPDELFTEEEASLAVTHAEECVLVAKHLSYAVE